MAYGMDRVVACDVMIIILIWEKGGTCHQSWEGSWVCLGKGGGGGGGGVEWFGRSFPEPLLR